MLMVVLVMTPVAEHRVKRELEYRIPRLHPPVNSRRSPDIFGGLCKNNRILL